MDRYNVAIVVTNIEALDEGAALDRAYVAIAEEDFARDPEVLILTSVTDEPVTEGG